MQSQDPRELYRQERERRLGNESSEYHRLMAEAKAAFDREQEAIRLVRPKDYLFRTLKAV